MVRDVPIHRHALVEIPPAATRPLFPNQIGDRICGATYDRVSRSYFVQPWMFPLVNQHAAPAGIQRDRIDVFDANTETYLLDLATLQTVAQWGNLAAFSAGEMTGLIEIPAPCAGSAVLYGAGCADRSSAIFQFEATGCAAAGAAFGLHLEVGYAAPYVVFAGISRTWWLGVPLPFELATLGGGACRILISNELI